MTQKADIEAKVRAAIAESLTCEEEAVELGVTLIDGLGAESLDFLDIVFKLERAFDIQITRGEMERAARGDMTDDEFAPDGVISEGGLARLRELMPEAADQIQPGLRPAEILGLFTPQTFVNLVNGKLEGQTV